MSEFEIHTVSKACPKCKTSNTITGSVDAFEEVHCWNCGEHLGVWSALVATTNQTSGDPHEKQPAAGRYSDE